MNKRLSIFAVTLTLLLGFSGASAIAQTTPPTPSDYKLLAPIPLDGAGSDVTTKTNTAKFLPGLVKLIIALATGMAVVVIIFAGLKYMTTEAFSGKSDAKDMIQGALWGLLLTMSAWLILNTVNPNLVTINLDITPQEITPGSLPGPMSPDGIQLGGTGAGYTGCPISDCAVVSVDHKRAPYGCAAPGPCVVRKDLNDKLVALNKAFGPITVTEAYPPRYTTHQNTCHNSGNCVDVRSVSANQMYSFLTKAREAGLQAVYEVESQEAKDLLIKAGCGRGTPENCVVTLGTCIAVLAPKKQPDGSLKRQITAEHFSVYNEDSDCKPR